MQAMTQQSVSNAFGGRVDPERRFDHGGWTSRPSGYPRLPETAVAMDCNLMSAMETETRMLLPGDIVDIEVKPDRSLLI